jgi:hypothetical protein
VRSEHQSAAARDDWQRYGLARHGTTAGEPLRDALGRPVEAADRRDAPDELFLQYRRETGQRAAVAAGTERSPRYVANLATIAVIGVLGASMLIFGVFTSPAAPVVSPSPSRFVSPTINASSYPVVGASSGPKTAHVNFLIDLPLQVAITDRDRPIDDGATMYLLGSKGGVAIDESRLSIDTVFGGPAFANGVRRVAVDGGIWVSSWPASARTCGPTCWAQATTYRIDPASGAVSKSLAATYLLGAADDGVWVATGKVVERLDPATGAVRSSLTWGRTSEPRIGCGALWSFTPVAQASDLAQIDARSGAVIGTSALDSGATYGPLTIEGGCWMMNGTNGTTSGSTTLVWLNADGTTQATFAYPGLSVVVIDGEFWLYGAGGKLQRLEATSGIGFGAAYVLAVMPPNDDPQWLFSVASSLWMISGDSVVSFGVPTGADNAAG